MQRKSLNTLESRKAGRRRIGIVVAIETFPIAKRFGQPDGKIGCPGFSVYRYDYDRVFGRPGGDIYVVKSGPGQVAAAAAAQLLITVFDVEAVFNFGAAGGLTESAKVGDVFLVESIVHYTFDCSELGEQFPQGRHGEYDSIYLKPDRALLEMAKSVSGLETAVCASGDMFVGRYDTRRKISRSFGADIAEMECAAIFMTAERCGVPALFIKGVSDGIHTAAENVEKHFNGASDMCFDALCRIIEFWI